MFGLKPPQQRTVTCDNCHKTFKTSLLGTVYCPYCRHPNKLELTFNHSR